MQQKRLTLMSCVSLVHHVYSNLCVHCKARATHVNTACVMLHGAVLIVAEQHLSTQLMCLLHCRCDGGHDICHAQAAVALEGRFLPPYHRHEPFQGTLHLQCYSDHFI
jgi:hypothetical protein